MLTQSLFASSVDGFVQYKVSYANREKCGFDECSHTDPPRLHKYHQQTTELTYWNYSYFQASNTTNVDLSGTCGPGTHWNDRVSPGSTFNNYQEDKHAIHSEWKLGPDCAASNTYSGTWTTEHEGLDNRTHDGYECDGTTICNTYQYDHETTPLSAALVQYVNGLAWCWTGTNHSCTTNAGCLPGDNVTNDTITGYGLIPVDVPDDHSYSLTNATLMHADYDMVDGSDTNSGYYTVDMANEYTDSELRTNILNRMAPYPVDWYTPSGTYLYFLSMIAYSVIDGNHVSGLSWWPGVPELQKMLYRFAIPNSVAGATYSISWDVITWDTSIGDPSVSRGYCQVLGTGDPINPVYTTSYEVMPPDWDSSREVWGGWVLTWVDNVRINMSGGDCSAGSGGPLALGGAAPDTSTCGGGGPCGSQNNSFDGFAAAFSMGQATVGNSAGSITTSAAQPSLNLATPAALSYLANSSNVEVISLSDRLRQVNAPQALADIVTDSPFAYEIRFYLPVQVGATTNGVHQVSGSPFVTWKIENPDASTNTYSRVRLSETRGSVVRVYDYIYTASPVSSKLDYPGGLREDECAVSITTNGAPVLFQSIFGQGVLGYTRTVTTTTRVPGGPDQFKVRRVYERFEWGEALVQQTLDPDTNPQTTTYVYYPDPLAGPHGHPLQKIIRPDGSWQWFTYDYAGRYNTVYSSLGNISPDGDNPPDDARRSQYYYNPGSVPGSGDDGTLQPDTPRLIVENEKGHEISDHYTAFPSADVRIDVQSTAPNVTAWSDPTSLFTTNRFYTNGPNQNRVKSVVHPDRTLQTFDYAADATGSYRTNMTASGQPDPNFSRVIDGTTNLTVVNLAGHTILSITRDVATGAFLSQEIYSNFDDFGRPQRVTHLDGTHEDTYYACCGVDNTI
ncbi:MAG: hypothetical protein WCT12_32135, partial [Verrucomicrobiota bacterium]